PVHPLALPGPADQLELPGDAPQAAPEPAGDLLVGVALHLEARRLTEAVVAEHTEEAAALVGHLRRELGGRVGRGRAGGAPDPTVPVGQFGRAEDLAAPALPPALVLDLV